MSTHSSKRKRASVSTEDSLVPTPSRRTLLSDWLTRPWSFWPWRSATPTMTDAATEPEPLTESVSEPATQPQQSPPPPPVLPRSPSPRRSPSPMSRLPQTEPPRLPGRFPGSPSPRPAPTPSTASHLFARIRERPDDVSEASSIRPPSSFRSGTPMSDAYSVRHGGVSRRRPARFSMLARQTTSKQRERVVSLVKKHLPTFVDAARGGFRGSERDYTDIVEYAKKVYESTNYKTVPLPRRAPSPVKDDASVSVAEEPSWLRDLRERIMSTLEKRDVPSVVIVEQATPAYDQLLQKEKKLEKDIEELRLGKKDKAVDNFPPLSAEALAKVKQALTGGSAVLVEAFNIPISGTDVATLRPGQWLNDEVINFYGNLILQRASTDAPKYPPVHYFNTFFYTTLVENGYERVRKWTKRVDLFSKQIVIIPVHLGMHWCCAVINFKKKRFEYYDSLHGSNRRCLQALRDYLERESLDKKKVEYDTSDWQEYMPKSIPHQENGYDCGVFTCMFAEYSSRDQPFDFSQKHMPYLRQRMVYEILSVKLMVS